MAIDPAALFGSAAQPAGNAFLDQYEAFVGALVDTATLRLANVAGTNAITATAEPFSVPATGLVKGMKFMFEPVGNNTGAVTLDVDGRGPESVVDAGGAALVPDALVSNTSALVTFDGSDFRILSTTSNGAGGTSSRTIYDSTVTWDNTFSDNTLVMVQLVAAGGGGGDNGGSDAGGGGGGAYAEEFYRAGDLPASLTLTVAGPAAVANDGVSTTFGSVLEAFGGAGGHGNFDDRDGGGGGGELAAANGQFGGRIGGGSGGDFDQNGDPALTIHGGGGGAGRDRTLGGAAVWGGAGGAGTGTTSAESKYGGNGGSAGQPGQRPGGGGGSNASGGGGRAIITIFG